MTLDATPSDQAKLTAVLLLIGEEIRAWETGATTQGEAETRIRGLVRSARGAVAPGPAGLGPGATAPMA